MARNLIRSTPFSDIARFDPFQFDPFRNVEELMRELSVLPSLRGLETESRIRMDVEENEKGYLVRADIPGVKKEDIKVTIEGNLVSVQAQSEKAEEEKQGGNIVRRERYLGQQFRSFSLPQEIDDKAAEAKYENGVLELLLPKKSGSVSTKLAVK